MGIVAAIMVTTDGDMSVLFFPPIKSIQGSILKKKK